MDKQPPTILIALLLLALLPTAVMAGSPPVKAPIFLKYRGNTQPQATFFLYRIRALEPDLVMEWEQDFRLGGMIITARNLAGSRNFFRSARLQNGREIALKGTMLVLSREVLDELQTGHQVKLKINNVGGWLKKTGESRFPVQARSLPCVDVVDNVGNTYRFLSDPRFPLLISFKSPHYSETLIEYYSGPDVIFRWYK